MHTRQLAGLAAIQYLLWPINADSVTLRIMEAKPHRAITKSRGTALRIRATLSTCENTPFAPKEDYVGEDSADPGPFG